MAANKQGFVLQPNRPPIRFPALWVKNGAFLPDVFFERETINDFHPDDWLTAPVAFSSYVAVADYEGYVHLLAQTDGRLVGRIRVDRKGVRVAPIVVGDTLYVFGNSGDLVALKLD